MHDVIPTRNAVRIDQEDLAALNGEVPPMVAAKEFVLSQPIRDVRVPTTERHFGIVITHTGDEDNV